MNSTAGDKYGAVGPDQASKADPKSLLSKIFLFCLALIATLLIFETICCFGLCIIDMSDHFSLKDSLRNRLIDIGWAWRAKIPFGNFDPLTQRSTEHLREVILLPANEIVMDRENVRRARSMGRLPGLFQDMSSFPGQEAWLNHFYSHLDTLFDYFPPNGLLTLIDPQRIEQGRIRFSERVEKESER